MAVQIGQISYSLAPAIAVPGMLADNGVNRITSKIASEVVNPGRGLELASDGSVQQCQQTSTTLKLYGFAILSTAQQEGVGQQNDSATAGGASYSVGEMVPVLRRGSMFVEWKGTTQVEGNVPNMYHSSTLSADRGKVTDAATSTSAGVEIAACPSWVQLTAALSGTGSVALVAVNSPGAV